MSILKQLEKKLPEDAKISEMKFEASEIILYTKNKDFFRNSEKFIKNIVKDLKRRIELRPDPKLSMEPGKAKKKIREIIPKEAEIEAIYFEPEMSKVVIEAKKPGLVIGKNGSTYRQLRNETFWLPKIERAPAIESKIVRAVRNLLHSEIDYRKKFLNRVGQNIATEPLSEEERENEWVRMLALGGFRQVGRSCILLQTPHSNIMLDCGIHVGGSGKESIPYIEAPEFNIEKLDAVCLSHAHLDHSGFIPYLYQEGFKGPLYCTAPTRDLMVLLCLDYIDVCQKEGKEIYYSKKSIEKTVKHSVVLDYGEVTDISKDVRLTFQPSGHLLGSALTHLHIGEGLHNILYTGDYKFGPSKLFDAAHTDFQRIETVITESTYGDKNDTFPKRRNTEEHLMEIINRTMDRGGKVLIPVFGVGRGQEIMAILSDYRDKGKFDYPVYLEGMVWDATAIHTAYPEYLSRYLQKKIFHYGQNPFVSEMFHRVVSKDRDDVLDSSDPAVIMATSGMLIGGPSVEYLRALAGDEKNTLIFVGYQGRGTLGDKIQRGWKEVPMRSKKGKKRSIPIEMEVETVSGLSGHSGRKQLVSYLYNLSSKPDMIVVNHGESKKAGRFSSDTHRMFKCKTLAPRNLEAVRLK